MASLREGLEALVGLSFFVATFVLLAVVTAIRGRGSDEEEDLDGLLSLEFNSSEDMGKFSRGWPSPSGDLDDVFEDVWRIHSQESALQIGSQDRAVDDGSEISLALEGPVPALPVLSRMLALTRALWIISRLVQQTDIDVIQAEEPHTAGLLAWSVAWIHDRRFVLWVGWNHEERFQVTKTLDAPAVLPYRKAEKALERLLLSRADGVAARSPDARDWAVRNSSPSDRTVELPPSSTDIRSSVGEGPTRSDERTDSPPRIALIGPIEPRSRVIEAVHAVASVARQRSDFVCVTVVDDPTWILIRDKASELGIEERVTRTVQDAHQLHEILASTDVAFFVAPNTRSLNAALEATPFVAFNLDPHRGLIDAGLSGSTVRDGDIQGMAQAIVDLLGDPGRVQKLGQASRQEAMDWMDPASLHDRRQAFYESLGSEGPILQDTDRPR